MHTCPHKCKNTGIHIHTQHMHMENGGELAVKEKGANIVLDRVIVVPYK